MTKLNLQPLSLPLTSRVEDETESSNSNNLAGSPGNQFPPSGYRGFPKVLINITKDTFLWLSYLKKLGPEKTKYVFIINHNITIPKGKADV